jgi:hypothetical protein
MALYEVREQSRERHRIVELPSHIALVSVDVDHCQGYAKPSRIASKGNQ